MTNESQPASKPQYEIGQEVYFYQDPLHMGDWPDGYMGEETSTEVVFKAQIYEIQERIEHNKKGSEHYLTYTARGLGNFLSSVRLNDKDIFLTEKDALYYARNQLQSRIEMYARNKAIFEALLKANEG